MSHGKHFTLFTHRTGPNGWKVAFILNELGLTYESMYLDFVNNEHKSPEYTKYNPNGRIPTLIDHRASDFTVWESNAIIIYLVENYDPEHKISVSDPAEKFVQLQWLFFQASEQGPNFGQVGWFSFSHHERLPSAIEHFREEVRRVLSVLESVLSKQEWLVGGKPTVADISFITWNQVALYSPGRWPAVEAWDRKLKARPAIARILAIKNSMR